MDLYLKKLKSALELYEKFPDSEWDDFTQIIKPKDIASGDSFIRMGSSADLIGFVGTGLFKVMYVNPMGQKFIRNFCSEGQFISCYNEAINAKLAEAEIQAIEDSEILFFSYKEFSKFYKKHQLWSEIGRKLAEKYFYLRENRERQLLTQTALDRYDNFLMDFKLIKHRIKQSDVAAYVGVTPESLSRLLKNQGEN